MTSPMDPASLKAYLKDTSTRPLPAFVQRDVEWRTRSRVLAITGARRCGKTFIMYQIMRDLLDDGHDRHQLVYLNFEHPVLSTIQHTEFKSILTLHWSLYPDIMNEPLFLFMDEPQAINGWESAVSELVDSFPVTVFITGSSSKLLSREIATVLRGRSLSMHVFTLSLGEFLRFKGHELEDIDVPGTAGTATLLNLLDEYLQYGGYPDVVLASTELDKMRHLQNYHELTLYRVLMGRYSVKQSHVLKMTLKHAVASSGKEFSVHKWFNTLKSQHISVGKDTLYELVEMLKDCGFIHAIPKHDPSLRNEELSIPKVYINDLGLYTLFYQGNPTVRLETSVALHLLRRSVSRPGAKVRYWKGQGDHEVDFIYMDGETSLAIQVSWSMALDSTLHRERRSLEQFLSQHPGFKGLVLTYNERGSLTAGDHEITVLPAWEWMLSWDR